VHDHLMRLDQLTQRRKGADLPVQAYLDRARAQALGQTKCTADARRSVSATLDLVAPVARLIAEHTRGPGLLGTDATGIPVLDPDAPEGVRNGTMWAWTSARRPSPVCATNRTRHPSSGDLRRWWTGYGLLVAAAIRAGPDRRACERWRASTYGTAIRGRHNVALQNRRFLCTKRKNKGRHGNCCVTCMIRPSVAMFGALAIVSTVGCGGTDERTAGMAAMASSGKTDAAAVTNSEKTDAALVCERGASANVIGTAGYDLSCNVDTDCVEVGFGNACTQCEIACPNAVVSKVAQAQYQADVAKSAARSDAGCFCPAAPSVCCKSGSCSTSCPALTRFDASPE
jgi:hypothetical protein